MNLFLIKFLRKENQYIRVVKYKSDKTTTVQYVKSEVIMNDKTLKINPNHIYKFNNFSTILLSDTSIQSIDPLDFNCAYDKELFESAIESKLIKDTFNTLKKETISREILLIALNIILTLATIYLLTNK